MSWENPRRRRTRRAPRRRYAPRWLRRTRRKPKTIPFETLIGAATIPFIPAASGYETIFNCIKKGDMTGVMDALKTGFLGFAPGRETNTINIAGLLNPVDFEHGRFTKILLYSAIIGMIRKKIAGKYTTPILRKIPFIGRWIS